MVNKIRYHFGYLGCFIKTHFQIDKFSNFQIFNPNPISIGLSDSDHPTHFLNSTIISPANFLSSPEFLNSSFLLLPDLEIDNI